MNKTKYSAALLKLLCQSTRVRIINLLRKGELSVTDIYTMLGLDQSNTSKHIAQMVAHDILECRKCGKAALYSIKHSDLVLPLVDKATVDPDYDEKFKVLGQISRARIVEALRHGEMPATSIMVVINEEQSNTARHLSTLKAAHIVDSRVEHGRSIWWLTNREYVSSLFDDAAVIVDRTRKMS